MYPQNTTGTSDKQIIRTIPGLGYFIAAQSVVRYLYTAAQASSLAIRRAA